MSDQRPEIPPKLSEEDTVRIEREIQKWAKHLEEELGPFTTERLPTGRILLLPHTELPHVCYMSDDGPHARLCVDDYVPELAKSGLDPNKPQDVQEGG